MSLKLKKENNDLSISVEEWKKTKDHKVLEKIINNHYPMIYSIINNINIGHTISKDDLFSEGVLGILTALDKFELKKNAKFSTYAYFWVRSKIYRFLKKINPLQDKKKHEDKLHDNDFSVFEDHEELLNKPLKSQTIQSLDDGDLKWSRFTNAKEIEHYFENQDIVSIIRLLLINLSRKEQTVVEKRYLSDKKHSFVEIAAIIGLSSERIRQMEKEIFNKLRPLIKKQYGSLRGELFLIQFVRFLYKN